MDLMDSLRMCVSCREMKGKNELIRVVKIKGEEPRIDTSLKAQGRGAYICRNRRCIENAVKRRAFERALKGRIKEELIKALEDAADE